MTLNAMRIAAALEREQALAQELLRRKKARPPRRGARATARGGTRAARPS